MGSNAFPSGFDHARELYEAGLSVAQISDKLGINKCTVNGWFYKFGVYSELSAIHSEMAYRRKHAAIWDDVVSSYSAGESCLSISRRLGIERGTVSRILDYSGVHARNGSEANLIRMAKLSTDERKAITAAANAAARGRVSSEETLMRLAQAHESSAYGSNSSAAEQTLFDALVSAGFAPVRQKAIGIYNTDLAVDSVAVEVFCGGWHKSGRHSARHQKRVRYLLDAGWHVVVVLFRRSKDPVEAACLDNLIAFLDLARRNPSMVRQYRMIGRHGQLIAARCANCDSSAFKPAYTASDDVFCLHLALGE